MSDENISLNPVSPSALSKWTTSYGMIDPAVKAAKKAAKKAAEEAAKADPNVLTLDPITTASWDLLNGKAKWDSQVALRGPDLVNSTNVKTWTTAVLRHRMSGVMRVGGQVNDWLPFVILPKEMGRGSSSSTFDWSHFLGHVYEAAQWLSIPVAWVNGADWKKITASRSNYVIAMAYLSTVLEPPFGTSLKAILMGSHFGMSEEGITNYATSFSSKTSEESPQVKVSAKSLTDEFYNPPSSEDF